MAHVRYEYGYNARGNQTSLRDNIFQTDPADAASIDRSAMRETVFAYDWQGRQTSRTLPDGSTEYFFYNHLGQTVRHVSFEGRVTACEYDAYGRLTKKSYYASVAAWNNGAGTAEQTIAYTYDYLGRVIREVDSKRGTTRTTYNADGQVSRIDSPEGVINYEYDRVTRQVSRTWTGTNSSSPITDTRYVYDALGRLASVSTYAREGALLASPEVAKYIYDVIGNLDKILHSNGIEERTSENGGAVKVTTYTIGHDVLAQYSAAFGFLTLLADGHGSTRAVADRFGNVLQQYNYDAYGNALGFNAADAMTNLLYSGEQFNPVSGLQYLRARWYNLQSGTFNRLDPYSGDTQSPRSFHKYVYALNNPISFSDPSGEVAWWLYPLIFGLIGASVGGYVSYLDARSMSYSNMETAYYVTGGVIAGGILGAIGGAVFYAAATSATAAALACGKTAATASSIGYGTASMNAITGAIAGSLAFSKKYGDNISSNPRMMMEWIAYMYIGAFTSLVGSTLGSQAFRGVRELVGSSIPATASAGIISGSVAGGSTTMMNDKIFSGGNLGGDSYKASILLGGLAGLITAGVPVSGFAGSSAAALFTTWFTDYSSARKSLAGDRKIMNGDVPVNMTHAQLLALQQLDQKGRWR